MLDDKAYKSKINISEIAQYVGQEVTLAGWLYNKRSSGKIHFLLLRDGTNTIQCVVAKDAAPGEIFDTYNDLTLESSLIVKGIVKEDKRSPIGFEIQVNDLKVIQIAEEYPIGKKEHGIDFLLDHRHLWMRSKRPFAVLRIRHQVVNAIRQFFNERGFILIDTPIFTPAACEGTTTLFETEYFGETAFLAQSGQLYAEAGAMAFGKVYCFGPTFRAEKSKTRRHLTEFWMVEPEVAYFDLEDDMRLAEDFITFIVQSVLENCKMELDILERDVEPLKKVVAPFPRIAYDEAIDILKKNDINFEWGGDFGGTDETIISSQFDRPVIIHRYPAAIKAFYMKRDPENEKLALAMDVLAPEGYGEIIGGSQREDDYNALLKRIQEHQLPREAFEWYLDLRKYGSVPHAGFGMGIERTVGWICGTHHIRETIPLPRTIYRLTP